MPLVSVPGSYQIVASFGGDTNHLPSSASAGPFVVAKAPTSVTALGLTTVGATLTATIGGKTQPLLQEAVRFTVSATMAGSPVLKETWVITDYLGRAPLPPTGLAVGTYVVKAEFAGNATYTPASASQTLRIDAQAINFDFGPGFEDSITYPGSVTFTVASTSGQPVTVGLVPDPSPFCTLTSAPVTNGTQYTLTATAAGLCRIVATAGETTTYAEVTVTRDVAIKVAQVISFGPLSGKVYGDAPFTVAATGGASGNPVTFSSTTASVCTVGGDTVTLVGAGTCTIAADQAGADFYNAAAQVKQSFTVGKAEQTIAFAPVPAQAYSPGGTFALSATATGGGAVTFTSLSEAVCTVAGSTATIVKAGDCVVRADQSGTSNYVAATTQQTIAIGRAAQRSASRPSRRSRRSRPAAPARSRSARPPRRRGP